MYDIKNKYIPDPIEIRTLQIGDFAAQIKNDLGGLIPGTRAVTVMVTMGMAVTVVSTMVVAVAVTVTVAPTVTLAVTVTVIAMVTVAVVMAVTMTRTVAVAVMAVHGSGQHMKLDSQG